MVDERAHEGVEKPSLAAHVQTYDGVIALLKWSTIVIAVVVVPLVLWLIAG